MDNDNGRAAIEQIVGQPEHRTRMEYVFLGSWDAHPHAHARVHAAELAFDRPVDAIWPSDHFGVVVDLEIDAGTP